MSDVLEDSLVEKLVYRLIKKHIAGTTMNSALERAQRLNKENILTSIIFLSGTADSRYKARYATTTYTELIRRISRLGLKSSVHVPVGQIGGAFDKELAYENLAEIINIGNKHGVFVWGALNGSPEDIVVAQKLNGSKGFGVAASHERTREVVKEVQPKAAKIIFDGKNDEKEKELMKEVELVADNTNMAVLSSVPEKLLRSILNSKYKKLVAFEFGMGNGTGKAKKVISKGAKASVSIPFGKDWTSYATEIVPEGNMHFIVSKLLKEQEEK